MIATNSAAAAATSTSITTTTTTATTTTTTTTMTTTTTTTTITAFCFPTTSKRGTWKCYVAQQDVIAVVTAGGCSAGLRCFHPKAASHNHVAVSGFAAAFAVPPISV